ncbi:hypothetical protein A3752_10765, partial [Oleiphilus sp. HI0081]
MCGLAGIIGRQYDDKITDLKEMSQAISSRGPDSNGLWNSSDGKVALAHRRLAIQDLSPAGHQPMLSSSGRYVLVFNGELYNFTSIRKELLESGVVFRGGSDTEVLLNACECWGVTNALNKFTGMFAFCLYDMHEMKVYLARDRVGEKPLYYFNSSFGLAFSSELKSFNNVSFYEKSTNKSQIEDYLKFGYSRATSTLYQGVKRLEQGHILVYEIDSQTTKASSYWNVSSVYEKGQAQPFKGSEKEAVDQLEFLLRQSIRDQLISDAPLGCFLSGGIDSSLVAALAIQERGGKLDTFSMGFDDPKYNEAPHARDVSNWLQTQHNEIVISEKDCLDIVPRLHEIYDEPFFDPSAIPTVLLTQFARKHVTVCLSGDGGDELFWGYTRYSRASHLWKIYKNIPFGDSFAFNAQKLSSSLSLLKPSITNRFNRAVYLLGSSSLFSLGQRLRHIFTDFELTKLIDRPLCNQSYSEDVLNDFSFVPMDDINDYLTHDILVKVD